MAGSPPNLKASSSNSALRRDSPIVRGSARTTTRSQDRAEIKEELGLFGSIHAKAIEKFMLLKNECP